MWLSLKRYSGEIGEGNLVVAENFREIPFSVKRVYYTYGADASTIRGRHAHKSLQQVLVCVYGKIKLTLDDAVSVQNVVLDSPDKGFLVDCGVWHTMEWLQNGSVLLVMASDFFSEEDYLRDYDKFLQWISRKKNLHERKGKRTDMKVPFNALKPQFEMYASEYLNASSRVLQSGWYILGGEVKAFEEEFAAYVGCSECVGLASGLDALTLSIKALNIGDGDEVILPSNTYIAAVLSVTACGACPIFVEPDNFYCINPYLLEHAVTAKTKAVLPVHLYGQPCEMEPILELCRKYSLALIEDCAQSHGATYRGRMTGTFGDFGCFSFYPTKNLGAFGDGGAVVTGNPDLAKKVRMLRNYGSSQKYINEIEGINSRLDEIQAALLRVKLEHLHELEKERREIAEYYLSRIKNPSIYLPLVREGVVHVWHLFVIGTENRDLLQSYLQENGIETQVHYPIPPHLSGAYERLNYKAGDFPVAEEYAATLLSLPLYNGMGREEIDWVCTILNRFSP